LGEAGNPYRVEVLDNNLSQTGTYVVEVTRDCSDFQRGDINVDGKTDIADPIRVLAFLFGSGTGEISCLKAADTDDDGRLNITDPVFLLAHLFRSAAAPPPPFGACGPDPTADALSCDLFSLCGVAP
jgi:hypothetical protein